MFDVECSMFNCDFSVINTSKMPTVTIIGAGPAGSAAAFLLARRGWDVTLIEQHRFPRDKVCGECLSAIGIDVLRRMGMAETVRCSDAAILESTWLHADQGHSAELKL